MHLARAMANAVRKLQVLLSPATDVERHGGVCKKRECKLYRNARSICLEFALLFLIGAYVTSYTAADMRWVLTAEPFTATLSRQADASTEQSRVLVTPVEPLLSPPRNGRLPTEPLATSRTVRLS